ncbi:MAG: hypothetical protein IT428_09665 [Planctomycetaceae bacterium]|nr:hypothetical protein [Planctomycetaceae bacterium]
MSTTSSALAAVPAGNHAVDAIVFFSETVGVFQIEICRFRARRQAGRNAAIPSVSFRLSDWHFERGDHNLDSQIDILTVSLSLNPLD